MQRTLLGCESHSLATQACWPVVKESRSIRGIACSVQMIWPVRRCHQRSGSLKRERTVMTARATRARGQHYRKREDTRLRGVICVRQVRQPRESPPP